MSRHIAVAGIDPSLSNFGVVKGFYDTVTGALSINEIKLIKSTLPPKTKELTSKTERSFIRIKKLVNTLQDYLADVDIIFAELPTGSQVYGAAVSYGVCHTTVASLNKKTFIVTPDEVKKITGLDDPNKANIIQWAVEQYPDLTWNYHKSKGEMILTANNEHCADAIAALKAGLSKYNEFME